VKPFAFRKRTVYLSFCKIASMCCMFACVSSESPQLLSTRHGYVDPLSEFPSFVTDIPFATASTAFLNGLSPRIAASIVAPDGRSRRADIQTNDRLRFGDRMYRLFVKSPKIGYRWPVEPTTTPSRSSIRTTLFTLGELDYLVRQNVTSARRGEVVSQLAADGVVDRESVLVNVGSQEVLVLRVLQDRLNPNAPPVTYNVYGVESESLLLEPQVADLARAQVTIDETFPIDRILEHLVFFPSVQSMPGADIVISAPCAEVLPIVWAPLSRCAPTKHVLDVAKEDSILVTGYRDYGSGRIQVAVFAGGAP